MYPKNFNESKTWINNLNIWFNVYLNIWLYAMLYIVLSFEVILDFIIYLENING